MYFQSIICSSNLLVGIHEREQRRDHLLISKKIPAARHLSYRERSGHDSMQGT